MKRTITLTALLLLATPALAQDAPDPTGPPAADVLAKLLKAADAKKVLQHRLLTKRFYKGTQRSGRRTWLLTSEGTQTKAGLEIKLVANVFERGMEGTLVYRYDPQFRLVGLRMAQKRSGRESGYTVTIANGVASGQRTRDGNPRGKPREAPWTGDRLSLFATLVLLPSLGDLGLADTTTILSEDEDDDIGKGRTPRVMTVRREKATATRQAVWVDSARRKRAIAKVLLGVGKDQGVVKEFLIDPKPDGRSDLHLELITAKQARELIKIAPLLTNEGRARNALNQVRYAQEQFRTGSRGNKGYAESIEELAKGPRSLIYDKDLKEGKSPGYMILVRRSLDKQSWMAVAVPEELGKTGRFFYVINNKTGEVHQSTKEIPLDDACKIPTDAKPVR